MWKEFRAFAIRGNLVDLTIGFIIGSAFSKVAQSIVNDILMPPLGLLIGRVDFTNLYINLSGKHYPTYAAAKQAGAPTINIGTFMNNVISFVLVAFVMFLVVRQINRLHKPVANVPTTKTCPYCLSSIPRAATRCAACTSELPGVTP